MGRLEEVEEASGLWSPALVCLDASGLPRSAGLTHPKAHAITAPHPANHHTHTVSTFLLHHTDHRHHAPLPSAPGVHKGF